MIPLLGVYLREILQKIDEAIETKYALVVFTILKTNGKVKHIQQENNKINTKLENIAP